MTDQSFSINVSIIFQSSLQSTFSNLLWIGVKNLIGYALLDSEKMGQNELKKKKREREKKMIFREKLFQEGKLINLLNKVNKNSSK